jgi:hypothetical protein
MDRLCQSGAEDIAAWQDTTVIEIELYAQRVHNTDGRKLMVGRYRVTHTACHWTEFVTRSHGATWEVLYWSFEKIVNQQTPRSFKHKIFTKSSYPEPPSVDYQPMKSVFTSLPCTQRLDTLPPSSTMPGLRELVFGVLCKHPLRWRPGPYCTRWNPSRHTIRELSDASSFA